MRLGRVAAVSVDRRGPRPLRQPADQPPAASRTTGPKRLPPAAGPPRSRCAGANPPPEAGAADTWPAGNDRSARADCPARRSCRGRPAPSSRRPATAGGRGSEVFAASAWLCPDRRLPRALASRPVARYETAPCLWTGVPDATCGRSELERPGSSERARASRAKVTSEARCRRLHRSRSPHCPAHRRARSHRRSPGRGPCCRGLPGRSVRRPAPRRPRARPQPGCRGVAAPSAGCRGGPVATNGAGDPVAAGCAARAVAGVVWCCAALTRGSVASAGW